MNFTHAISSLLHLWSFSHAQCDAILQQRGIEVSGAYAPGKAGLGRDSVYFGFFWIAGWLAVVCWSLVYVWRNQTEKTRVARYVLPFFAAGGIGMFCLQLLSMAKYVDACRHVLGTAGATVTGAAESAPPLLVLLLIGAFAGAWIVGTTLMLKHASTVVARATALLLLIIGGSLLVAGIAEMVIHLFR